MRNRVNHKGFYFFRVLILAFVSILSFSFMYAGDVLQITNGGLFYMSPSALVSIKGNVILNSGGTYTQNDTGTVFVSGNMTMDGTLNSGNGAFIFNDTLNSTIDGSSSPGFHTVYVNKTAAIDNGFYLKQGITVKRDLTLTNGVCYPDRFRIYIGGNFNNNATFTQATSTVVFNGSAQQFINGRATTFYDLWINKTSDTVKTANDVEVDHAFRIVSNSVFNIQTFHLTIGPNSGIYPDSASTGNDPVNDPFSINKYITCEGDSATLGKIIRKIPAGALASDRVVRFPIGTRGPSGGSSRVYSPGSFFFMNGMTTFGANASISLKCIPAEHPAVVYSNVSLKKYWQISTTGIDTIYRGGFNARFDYHVSEVQGDESKYTLCLFRQYSAWFINPGSGFGVETVNHRFRVDEVTRTRLDGEWTCGQPESVSLIYYTRKSGNFSDATTWSRVGYGGAAASNAPNSINDLIYIGNHDTITVLATPPYFNVLTVDTTGAMLMAQNAFLQGDTCIVKDNTLLGVASVNGITAVASSGNIQTSSRILSSKCIYLYNGTTGQVTGNGIPNTIRSLIIQNTGAADSSVTLSQNVLISDSLVINRGVLSTSIYNVDGETPGKTFTMRGGEFQCLVFPSRYTSPSFTAGTINFTGTGSVTIPSDSSISVPPVKQYFNLKFSGARGANTYITLSPIGEIIIKNNFDISQLTWSVVPNADRFIVTGSNVVFDKSGGTQDIPSDLATAQPLTYRLTYYDLTIRGTGNKRLVNGSDRLYIRNNLYLEKDTLSANGFDIWVLGDWYTTVGTTFLGGTNKVTFEANGGTDTILSNGISFNKVDIRGSSTGLVRFIDKLTINDSLNVSTVEFESMGFDTLQLNGHFTIGSGKFIANSGTVLFSNTTSNQTFTHSGVGNFHNITVRKTRGLTVNVAGTTVVTILDSLTLFAGNIGGRTASRPVLMETGSQIIRPGTTPGHIDGILRLPVPLSATTHKFDIGEGTAYVPLTLAINGSVGTVGYLEAMTGLDTTAVNVGRVILNTIDPNGAALDTTKNVRRYWTLNTNFTGNTFNLGTRDYDLEVKYLRSDLRGSPTLADSLKFEMRQRDGTVNAAHWFRTNTGVRADSSIQITGNTLLPQNTTEYFFVGEPKVFNFYSIADGNWSASSSWSTAGYGGQAATRAPLPVDNVFIGDGKLITLDADQTVNSGLTVLVEKAGPSDLPGTLICGTRTLGGTGTFTLGDSASLSIGSRFGITTAVASATAGNIQTTTRNYNGSPAHSRGNFIYTSAGSGVPLAAAAGDGLPLTINSLTVNMGTAPVILTIATSGTSSPARVLQIRDSFNIVKGVANIGDIITKLGGNFRISTNGSFNPGTTRIALAASTAEQVDSANTKSGFIWNGYNNIQELICEDTTRLLKFSRFSLKKPGGVVISTNNIHAPELLFYTANRVNLDMSTHNKYIIVYDGAGTYLINRPLPLNVFTALTDPLYGYVDGRLIRGMQTNDNRVWPIGTKTRYSPVELTVNNVNTAGLIEVVATDGNHPKFNTNGIQIKPASNIQRFWEISTPTIATFTQFALNAAGSSGNTMNVRLIYYPDDIRGGANPVNDYWIFRKQNIPPDGVGTIDKWTNTLKITNPNASRLATETAANLNTPVGVNGNGIFCDVSQFSSANCMTLMVGDQNQPNVRYFYSRADGNWNDNNTWSPYGYSGTAYGAGIFPNLNSGTDNDIVLIGDTAGASRKVTLNIATGTATAVYVDKFGVGESRGILSCPGDNYLNCNQYVQKNGGHLEIGSPSGISALGSVIGNIRASITRNYNWNQYNNNHFSYIGTADQVTGAGLPAGQLYGDPVGVGMLEIKNTGFTVTLNDSVLIRDSLKLSSGTLRFNSAHPINLKGDLINNVTPRGSIALASASTSATTSFNFIDTLSTQRIRGTADSTIFPSNVVINKANGVLKDTTQHVKILGDFKFNSPTIFDLCDTKSLTLDATSKYSTTGVWGITTMVKVSGGPNTGTYTKYFNTGSPRALDSLFIPIGEDSLGLRSARYSEANIKLNNMNYAAGANATLTLRSLYPHPNAPAGTPSLLKKYWSVSNSGISRAGATSTTDVRLTYTPSEVMGNQVNYVPEFYRRAPSTGWSFNLNNAASAAFDTLNKVITVTGSQRTPDVDWTAGDPSSFQLARSYFSRASGNWDAVASWSNDNTSGPTGQHNSQDTALNYPGFFPGDKVYIDKNFVINYNKSTLNPIDSLIIGNTPTFGNQGELQFVSSAGSNKLLTISRSVNIGTNGLISKQAGAVTSIDTLRIYNDLTNGGTAASRGINNVATSATNRLMFDFVGATQSTVSGTGNFTNLGIIGINKQDALDTLINTSTTLSSGLTGSNFLSFNLNSGVYRHENAGNARLSVSSGSNDLIIADNTCIDIPQGTVTTGDGFVMQQGSSVLLRGGNMIIGNAANEHFQYETGSNVSMSNASIMTVAGSFRRRYITSSLNFSISGSCVLNAVNMGSTTDINNRRAGFDIGAANSVFNQTGGTIKVMRPMDSSTVLKDPDYNNNSETYSVTGGTVQMGDLTQAASTQAFTVLSYPPFWNLDIEHTFGQTLTFGNNLTIVRNDLSIRNSSVATLNGQNLNLGGDLTTSGNGKLLMGTSGSRDITFIGDASASPATKKYQTVSFGNALSDKFFNISLNKPSGGQVILSQTLSNSDMIITNELDFDIGNQGIINAGTARYVQLGTNGTDVAAIQRLGLGHVAGELRWWTGDGVQIKNYPVGDTLHYTPAIFQSTAGTGTPGLLSVTAYGSNHPDILALRTAIGVDTAKNIYRYWRVIPTASLGYSLGSSGRTYSLSLQYIPGNSPTGDVRNSADYTLFEHYIRVPDYPTAGTWDVTTLASYSDTTAVSTANLIFGDFLIAENVGRNFYSIANGDWNQPSTWSNADYTGAAATDYPRRYGDRIFIGNGKSVILSLSNPNVRSVTVEKFNNLPGSLAIQDDRFIKGISFILKDDCTIKTTDGYGFTSLAGPLSTSGSIRSKNIRSYGVSRYEYNGVQNQSLGDGVPPVVKTLTINNNSNPYPYVSVVNSNLTVNDTLDIANGIFKLNATTLNLKGNVILGNTITTELDPGTSNFWLDGTADQYAIINKSNGLQTYKTYISKLTGNIFVAGSTPIPNFKISNNLTFENNNTANIDTRTSPGNGVVSIDSGATLTRLGSGYIDGRLRKFIPASVDTSSMLYEIGYKTDYTPLTLEFTSGTGSVKGNVEAVNFSPLLKQPFSGNRIDTTFKVDLWWSITAPTGSSFAMGTRLMNTILQYPKSLIMPSVALFDTAQAEVRRKSIPADPFVWMDRRGLAVLDWVDFPTYQTVRIAPQSTPAIWWSGLGEFYIGYKSQRIFYSRASGLWTDSLSWSFYPGGIPNVPSGEFPNPDWNAPIASKNEIRDSVVIQNSDVITLNTIPELAYLAINGNGTLLIPNGNYLMQSSILTSVFVMNGGWINNKTPLGIETDTSISILRFVNRTFHPEASFIFSGALNQKFGNAFPDYITNLTINNDANTRIVSSLLNNSKTELNISGNLTITRGDLRLFNNLNIRLGGDLTDDGIFNATIDNLNASIVSTLTINGSGNTNQTISGSGTLLLDNLKMNRGAGSGILQANKYLQIANQLDLRETGNLNNQIITLGSNIDMSIFSSSANAIINYSGTAPLSYIRTDLSSGLLIRKVSQNNTYTYPIGSFETTDKYTPLLFTTGATGNSGSVGVRGSKGSNATPAYIDGHARLIPIQTTDYVKRYFVVDSVTTSIPAKLRFYFNSSDIAGLQANINRIGRWRPQREVTPGAWRRVQGPIDYGSFYFETNANVDTSDYYGDFTIANAEAFRRSFFSRQSGNWNDGNAWTFSRTHVGPPAGEWPNEADDSVQVGGGNLGIGDHSIVLNVGPINTIGGLAVGTSLTNSGTLDFGTNIVKGEFSTVSDYSTLKLGSPDGITLAAPLGNLQTTYRTFAPGGFISLVYNGVTNQSPGDALPNSLRNLTIDISGITNNNSLILNKNISIFDNLYINLGALDLQTFTTNNSGAGISTFSISPNALLRLSGTNNLSLTTSNYDNYIVDINSTIEFYGSDQNINVLPAGLNSGLGNVVTSNPGIKLVNAPLLIRGNLSVTTGSTLSNIVGVNALSVLKNVINSSIINNCGVIEIGQ